MGFVISVHPVDGEFLVSLCLSKINLWRVARARNVKVNGDQFDLG